MFDAGQQSMAARQFSQRFVVQLNALHAVSWLGWITDKPISLANGRQERRPIET